MKRKEPPKPRNPVSAYMKRSGSGVHGKSRKAERRSTKVALRKKY